LAAALFVVPAIAMREAAEVSDEGVAISEPIGADASGNAGSQNLLGTAAADAEERFDSGAVNKRAGKSFEGLNYCRDSAIPEGFSRHGYFCMLVRTRAKCKNFER
jgi:hypothetical protein